MSAWAANPQVELVTNKGKIVLELYPEKAPATVANFLQYVKDKHYDSTIFHRVVAGFVVQGGGFDAKMNQKATRAPVKNEAQAAFKAGLKNDRGTVAMARTNDPNSASSQFYVNLKNNDFLNWPGSDGFGYAVFGKVVAGLDVVDKIAAVKTMPGDAPLEPVVLQSARELPAAAAAK
ncbi:peptidylprolyl isomerase [Jeongeupia sp. HS-3]|uniref:peptidylprolyl isomerase n=1 Tax=Jeongeupia sp. HS-3 TaxID=1009682 RepID=UPI001F1E5891|nr:peptidylprolyl isomerase [Jeongeupia sp. HS-3]